jgi:hypothetical protein
MEGGTRALKRESAPILASTHLASVVSTDGCHPYSDKCRDSANGRIEPLVAIGG